MAWMTLVSIRKHEKAKWHTKQSLQDSAIMEFSTEFRFECGSTEFHGITCFGVENRGTVEFPWRWRLSIFWTPSSHFGVGIPISWSQNFHSLRAEFWVVRLEHHCSFWVQFQYFTAEIAFSELRILGGLFGAVFERQLCIFGVQNFYFSVQNFVFFSAEFHFLSAECWRVWQRCSQPIKLQYTNYIRVGIHKGGLTIEGCKIEGLLK